jgi:hypothetical protein
MKQRSPLMVYLGIVFLFLALPLSVAAGEPAHIGSFSPQGTVKGVRQVRATFSQPMVSFGDPRLADPFVIQCPAPGRGRWIDSRTWSFDFAADLPGGLACEFRLRDDIRSSAGSAVEGQKVFRFSTGGPAIVNAQPREGSEYIDERQIFILQLDAEPRLESLAGRIFFSVASIEEPVAADIVTGRERKKILKAVNYKGDENRVILLQARQTFPAGAVVKLIWGRGIAAQTGVATDKDQVLTFRSRLPFRADFSCRREKADRDCIPLLPLNLAFTAPVPLTLAERVVITGPGGKEWRAKIDDGDRNRGWVSSLRFPGPFPEKAKLTLKIPPRFMDDARRPLTNIGKFPLPVVTDAYPPLAKFSSRFGIIEAQGERLLPVTVRNIERSLPGRLLKIDTRAPMPVVDREGSEARSGEDVKTVPDAKGADQDNRQTSGITGRLTGRIQRLDSHDDLKIIAWLRKVAAADRERPILDRQTPVLKLPERAEVRDFEVVGIPLPGPGFFVVELESRILGEHLLPAPAPVYVPAAVLTTNLAAHFKWGRESSLVWVTALDNGAPVPSAAVMIRDCTGKVHWRGKTDHRGVAIVKTRLPAPDRLPRCSGVVNYHEAPSALSNLDGGLFVFARRDVDMTFTHSSWDEGIEPWRFQLSGSGSGEEDGIVAHTVTDRPLYRAGETVHLKHILRMAGSRGFSLAPAAKLPQTLEIRHVGSEQTYSFPLSWRGVSSAETTWKIPENARLGTYELNLVSLVKAKSSQERNDSERRRRCGSFRVEEFRVPLMKAAIQPSTAPLVDVREAVVDLSAHYLSGGGAAGMPVRLRAEVRPQELFFKDYDGYSFTGGVLKEGIVKIAGHDFIEGEEDGAATGEPAVAADGRKAFLLPSRDLQLDRQGSLRTALHGLPKVAAVQNVHVEMEFRDPNGEIQTAAANIPLYPAALLIGLRPDTWMTAQDDMSYKVAVVDLQGKPVPGAEAVVDIYQERTYSHRVRLVGGFYAYKHIRELKKLGRHCRGLTDAAGMLSCRGPAPAAGSVILHGETKDRAGRVASANYQLWVAGREDLWFEAGNDDRIDVLPEKKRFMPGEKAKFQVRMPFREATALITVEREGILDVYTRRISGKAPVVEIPVKKNYAPNVFVSVLVVRGRSGASRPTATFDPGKPAYKLGIAEIQVGWQAHQLSVQVTPERDVYKIRDNMNVLIKVQDPEGRPLPGGSEVAVAAVDKGLLQLLPNESWQLLKAMMKSRSYEIRTATAQAMVVGKRHFGMKSVSHGGGGGRQFTRELFDTLLYWKGSVPLDARGEASLRIPLNDSLTGFRIVAVATAGAGMFGTGEADIRTSQDLMLVSGLPPLVRGGDRYRAGFTVRNTSDHDMEIVGRLRVSKDASAPAPPPPRAERIPAGAARELAWWVSVPPEAESLEYEVTVQEQGGGGSDSLKVVQKVVPAVPVRTVQAVLAQVGAPLVMPLEKPATAAAGRGGLSVELRPALVTSLQGVRDYMENYRYTCLEQKASRAVALRSRKLWQSLMAQLPAYLDGDGLAKFFPGSGQGNDTLTSYLLAVAAEAGYEIPAQVRERMTDGLRKFVEGRIVRYSSLPTADLGIRKLAAVEALSRYGQASARQLTSIAVEPNLWPTSALLHWLEILRRVADIPRREELHREAEQILRSRINFHGSRITFATEGMDNLWWLMTSPDGNAVRTLLTVMNSASWREELPRLAAGALGRMRQGRWDTTTANAWGIMAMARFSAQYDKTPVAGTTTGTLNGVVRSLSWAQAPAGGKLNFPWPAGKTVLQVNHQGGGAPWATVGATAAVRLAGPFSAGFRLTRTITRIAAASGPGRDEKGETGSAAGGNTGKKVRYAVGDVLRIRLDMEARSDMTWVVVDDPVPAGASILGTGLGGDSRLSTAGEQSRGNVQEAFTERSRESFRVYYEYVPKGKWFAEYTLRLNNEGIFQMPAARIEALYAPEMYGETPVAPLEIAGR